MAIFLMGGRKLECVPVAFSDIKVGKNYVRATGKNIDEFDITVGMVLALTEDVEAWEGRIGYFGGYSLGEWTSAGEIRKGRFIYRKQFSSCLAIYHLVSIDGVRV